MAGGWPEHAGEVDAALRAIVSDPVLGAAALDNPQLLSNLLSDYLPEAPMETGLLIAAADARLPAALRDHASRGMDPATAVRIAAGSLAARTAFTAEACGWVTRAIAIALGLAAPGQLTAVAPPAGQALAASGAGPVSAGADLTEPAGGQHEGQAPFPAAGSTRRRGRWPLAAAGSLLVTVLGTAIAVALAHAGTSTPGGISPPGSGGTSAGRGTPGAGGASAAGGTSGVPAPSLARFVPANQQVLGVYHVDLVRGETPAVAVTTISTPTGSLPSPPEDLILLTWDKLARRWSVAYDAQRTVTYITGEPDATTSSIDASIIPQALPIISPDESITHLRVAEIRDQPDGGADLMFTATFEAGASGYGQLIGIIHYDGHIAKIAWAYRGNAGTVTVNGKAPAQRIAVTDWWQTASDPHCCALRSYRFVAARSAGPAGETYTVVQDDRPLVGAIVSLDGLGITGTAAVTTVIPGSPAAGVLLPGDVIASASGSYNPAGKTLNGPAVVDEIASHLAGDTVQLRVYRAGNPMTVTVRRGTLASPQAASASKYFQYAAATEYLI